MTEVSRSSIRARLRTAAVCLVSSVAVPAVAMAQVPSRAPSAVDNRHTAADVRFMQGMITHHAQAVVMSALIPQRTDNKTLRMLGERITVSQRDEIAMMRSWLADRKEWAPDPLAPNAMGGHDMSMPGMKADAMMPGMLTPEQMTQLAQANGKEFEKLFLAGMIQHHGGALTMVAELFASPGAGQEGTMFRFASDVDADQRAEITRMKAMLAALQK